MKYECIVKYINIHIHSDRNFVAILLACVHLDIREARVVFIMMFRAG